MASVRVVDDDAHYQSEMSSSGTKLVVVDFTASWCGPCQRIAPVFEQLSRKYPRAVFLKVDVDKCQDTAAGQGVSAMPTFIFYRNKTKIDSVRGADPSALETKIQQYYGSEDSEDGEGAVAGHVSSPKAAPDSPPEAWNTGVIIAIVMVAFIVQWVASLYY